MSRGNPGSRLRENIHSLLKLKGIDDEILVKLLDDVPRRWERFDDVAIIPSSSFRMVEWESIIDNEFWIKVCQSLNVERLARSGEIIGEKRESTVEMLVGNNDWVIRKENGIKYGYNITQCMFSSGNINERRRMGEIVTENEIVAVSYTHLTLPTILLV